jgi:hypothetical protein
MPLSVIRICRLVEGMPLGIELAASWVEVLSLDEIAHEIGKSLDFLETDMRDLPTRHRSIRAVFEYSWQLMRADEQVAFAKLSVFRGGFTREAAGEVAGATLRILSALVNKSLIRRNPQSGRYAIHELLRQYGAVKLTERGLSQVADQAFSEYFADYMETLWLDLKGRNQVAALNQIEVEFQNLTAAWLYLAAHANVERMVSFAGALWYGLDTRSRYTDIEMLFNQALQLLKGESHWLIGYIEALLGWATTSLGFAAKGQALAEAGIRKLEQSDHMEAWIMSLSSHAFCMMNQGKHANDTAERAVKLARESNQIWGLTFSLFWHIDHVAVDDLPTALSLLSELLDTAQTIGELRASAFASFIFASFTFPTGDYPTTRKYAQQGLAYFEQINMPWGINACITMLADVCKQQQDFAGEKRYLLDGLRVLVARSKSDRELLEAILRYSDSLMSQNEYANAFKFVNVVKQYPRLMPSFIPWVDSLLAKIETEWKPNDAQLQSMLGASLDLDSAVRQLLAEA